MVPGAMAFSRAPRLPHSTACAVHNVCNCLCVFQLLVTDYNFHACAHPAGNCHADLSGSAHQRHPHNGGADNGRRGITVHWDKSLPSNDHQPGFLQGFCKQKFTLKAKHRLIVILFGFLLRRNCHQNAGRIFSSGGVTVESCDRGLWAATSIKLRQVASSRLTYSSEKARR